MTVRPGTNGRPLRHGAALKLADQGTWPVPAVATVTQTTRCGTAQAAAWGRLHQQLASRAGWEDHDGKLPIVEGTLIRLRVDHLPGDRSPGPLWPWSSRAGTDADAVNRTWQAFLRRFDIERTFKFFRQVLGWTRPRLRDPARNASQGAKQPRASGLSAGRHGHGSGKEAVTSRKRARGR